MTRPLLYVTVLVCLCIMMDLCTSESEVTTLMPVVGRSKRSEIVLLDKIKTCVRNALNTLEGTAINCSFKKMHKVLIDHTRTNCKNCNP